VRRSTLFRAVFLLACTSIGAGAQSPRAVSATPSATQTPERNPLIEIKIRRARWNISLESLQAGPVTPAGQQDVKVAIAPAEDDLVSKQIVNVSCTGVASKSAEFGPEGGILTLSLDAKPADVKVVVALEFTLPSGLAATTKTIDKHIAGEGLLILYQAFSDTTNMFVDRGVGCRGDYLWADLAVTDPGKAQPQRHILLSSSIGGRLVSTDATFNVLAGDDDPPLRLSISGRLQGYWPAQLAVIEPQAIRTTPSLSPKWDPYRARYFLAPTP
jgi:hypothetical protein